MPSYLRHTCTHTRAHIYVHACTFALRLSHRDEVDEVGRRINPLSNSNPSHRRFPPSSAVDRVTRQARNVVIAEVMVVPTVRRDEQNGGDYVTLKFNSAIVSRTRETEFVGTLILFLKTATPPTNARRKESSGNSRANSWGVMQSVSCTLALCKSPCHFETC